MKYQRYVAKRQVDNKCVPIPSSLRVAYGFFFLMLGGVVQVGSGQSVVLPEEYADEIIKQTHLAFWGNAVDHMGNKIMLPAGADPAAPILPLVDSRRVVAAAVPVGLAVWCEVEWQPSYLAFMQRERSTGLWSETQVAFIGSLFGMSQGVVARAMASKQCTPEQRVRVVERLY